MFGLVNQVALVAGGAGAVGEGIVKEFLAEGATVVVPSRSMERLQHLKERVGSRAALRLVLLEGEVGDPVGADMLREAILASVDRIDHVVASLGAWWQGPPLVNLPYADWAQLLNDHLTSHLVTAQTFLPALLEHGEGTYTMINGGAARIPMRFSGPVSVLCAAQVMLKDVLVAENRGSDVRINTLLVNTPVITRDRPEGPPEWLTAEDIGDACVYLASDNARSISGESFWLERRSQLAELGMTPIAVA